MHLPNAHTPAQQQSPGQRGPTPQQGWSTPVMQGALPTQQNGAMYTPGQNGQVNPEMQFNASLAQAQANAGMSRNVPTPVTQTGIPTPLLNRPMNSSPRPVNGQQLMPGPMPNMAPNFSSRNIHPIEKDKFLESLPQYLMRQGKTLDERRMIMPSGQRFDLHMLHTLVINQGGGPAVSSVFHRCEPILTNRSR